MTLIYKKRTILYYLNTVNPRFNGPRSVSYTHLDVYKRQVLAWMTRSGVQVENKPTNRERKG